MSSRSGRSTQFSPRGSSRPPEYASDIGLHCVDLAFNAVRDVPTVLCLERISRMGVSVSLLSTTRWVVEGGHLARIRRLETAGWLRARPQLLAVNPDTLLGCEQYIAYLVSQSIVAQRDLGNVELHTKTKVASDDPRPGLVSLSVKARRRTVEVLCGEPMRINALARSSGVGHSLASYHVGLLSDDGIVDVLEDGRILVSLQFLQRLLRLFHSLRSGWPYSRTP